MGGVDEWLTELMVLQVGEECGELEPRVEDTEWVTTFEVEMRQGLYRYSHDVAQSKRDSCSVLRGDRQ